jgi:chromosome segregation protein
MYLSKLEIIGFKSFANKTNILLNDGITAIVGPNGCGKTNIVDALRWALGEQRYSTLRSDKMEDVIFNGSKNRKPIGAAEVSLTIQNNKGILPIEYNEVTITRRLYRSGDSDYLLNKTLCRLKDIVSLFMDTGMGSNAYSVIELKMVETILSDKVEERRRLFEEAAGVTRYKARRKEALRKLSDVDVDLIRVDDIISEVAKAVNSLNRQAKKAERYNEYLERLQALEIDVMQRDYSSLFDRLEPLEQRLDIALNDRLDMQGTVDQDERELQQIRSDERGIEAGLEEIRNRHSDLVTMINDQDQKIAVSQERERTLRGQAGRLSVAREQYEKRMTEIDAERRQLVESIDILREAYQKAEEAYRAHRDAHFSLEESLSGRRSDAQSRQSRVLEFVQEITRLQSDMDNHAARMEAIQISLDRLAAEEEQAASALSAFHEQHSTEHVSQSRLMDTALDAEREFHAMEERKQTIRAEIDLLQNHGFELQALIGEKMTRIDFLSGLVDRLEGYSDSVRHLLRSREWSATQYGTIADAINTRDEFRVAIEAALGDAAHYIVVNDVPEAISGLHNLKHHRKGKATFVCLARIPQGKAAPFAIAGDGVIGWAIDHVRYEDRYNDLFQFMLKNVLLVRDVDVATASVRESPLLRCVTLDGDIFESNGMVRGGSHGQEEGGLIGKKDQIIQLTGETEGLKRQLEENQRRMEAKNSDYLAIDLRRYADNMKQTQQELSTQERRIAQALFEIEKCERQVQKCRDDRAMLQGEMGGLVGKQNELLPMIDNRKQERTNVEQSVEQENQELRELEKEYNRSSEELNALNVAVVEKRNQLQNAEHEIERLNRAHAEAFQSMDQSEREGLQALVTADELVREIAALEQNVAQSRLDKLSAEELSRTVEAELAQKRNEADQFEKQLHEERQRHSQTVAMAHDIELKVTELKQRIEAQEQHAREAYSIELQRARYTEDDVFDLAQAKEEIADLRTKIKTLGLVNPLAFEEWKQEKDRLDLLTTQREDLLQSKQTLTDTITEINETAKQKFIETFALIRENFIMIFKSLFDEGDQCDLILEDNPDPLEARIDIVARPRGKRPHSIDMLSGGEKTLTAIALLFAIYLVKPSPFCILDEVDAPLDDANIDRYVRIIRQFSDNTQFIVVTHNKRTMAAADTLYGVTMEEEGISKIVAVDFNSDNLARFSNN